MVETMVAVLQKYELKLIVISARQLINLASLVQEKLGNFNPAYEDKCIVLRLDTKWQRQILERTLNF